MKFIKKYGDKVNIVTQCSQSNQDSNYSNITFILDKNLSIKQQSLVFTVLWGIRRIIFRENIANISFFIANKFLYFYLPNKYLYSYWQINNKQ